MAGESVALNPALRERNRNLKGCGLTGLLFWVGIAHATLRSKNSRQSPRWGCAGASSEGGKGFPGNAVRRILPDRSVGVLKATGSHALSNTWKSVQEFGLPKNGPGSGQIESAA